MFFNTFFKIIKIIVVASVFSVLILGLLQTCMNMNTADSNENCLFGGHSVVICQMNPIEHIQEWQSMFRTLPARDVLLYLFTFVMFISFIFQKFWNKFSIHNTSLLFSRPIHVLRDSFQVFDPIQEAFSSGILNPKSF